ncbi:M24 family metallopeptidase [Candidatus Lokiarchaeum ossiferum]|uniref:M24 family metallopeptidase n=1 Tax=Candidatus Lokiarchaeum ossiferum TaxID=2951803 RepID=UPI00352D6551
MESLQQNVKRIQTLLKNHAIDAMLCTLGQNFRYVFGLNAHPSERLIVALISPLSEPLIILPSFEMGNVAQGTFLQENQLIGWEEIEDPFALVAKKLTQLHVEEGKIAISPQMPYTMFSRIQEKLPNAQFCDGLSIFEEARISKTDHEIEMLKKASSLSAEGIEAAFHILSEGMTELDVAKFIKDYYAERTNGEDSFVIVQFGENSSNPHAGPTSRKLKKGDVVLIDAGTTLDGYWGDITNTTFFGTPTEEFLKIYGIVERANQAAVLMGKIGKTGHEVDAAARQVIQESGYGEFFTHRTGHGIGLDIHESPYMLATNENPLLLNNVYTVEPGIYLPGKFGVRIEDDVFAQDKSGVRLSTPKRRFWA